MYTESVVEETTLEGFHELDYDVLHGPDIDPITNWSIDCEPYAFTGQLVPQDPNEEPASVLLGRIKAERAAMGDGKWKNEARTESK